MATEGQSSSGVPPKDMDIPLALRKRPRATAGIKKEPLSLISPEKMESSQHANRPKESVNKAPPKRKLASPTPSSSSKDEKEDHPSPTHKKRKNPIPKAIREMDSRNDFYCWICHREGSVICCEVCPRVYHVRCVKLDAEPEGDWFCPECEKITQAECVDTQSSAMSKLTLDHFCRLLMYALQRMKHSGTELFQKPVQLEQHPNYMEYVFHPMDLSTLEKNISKKVYGCTEAFLADTKWILHNCILYNGANHKLSSSARMIVRICEHEMSEIEICPDCYLSSCMKKENYFCEPCREPHKLVWAKLKGFPFWPAKALRQVDGQVDVRFFGQHDRAWVPASNCYMMSQEIPFPIKKRKGAFENAMQEMELHIENIRRRHGRWTYAPYRSPFDPGSAYNHNHLKAGMQQQDQGSEIPNGVNSPTANASSNATPKKVGKIKIRIKKEAGMPTLTLEGACQESMDTVVPGDGTQKEGEKQTTVDKSDKHLCGKSRNIFDAMKIVNKADDKSQPCLDSETPMKTGLLKLKIGGGVVKSASPDCQEKAETLAAVSRETEVLGDDALSEKKVPAGIFEISGDDDKPSAEKQAKAKKDTAKDEDENTCKVDAESQSEQRGQDARSGDESPETHKENVCAKSSESANGGRPKDLTQTPEKQEVKKDKLSTPSILPTKLPSLENLEEATSQRSPEPTNPVTPPSNRSTPSTDKFKIHLDKTIESCKASLGLKQIDHLEEMEEPEKDGESESDAASLSNNSDDDDSSDDAMEEEVEGSAARGSEEGRESDQEMADVGDVEEKGSDVASKDGAEEEVNESGANHSDNEQTGEKPAEEIKSENVETREAETAPVKTEETPPPASTSPDDSPATKSPSSGVKDQESEVADMDISDVNDSVSKDTTTPVKTPTAEESMSVRQPALDKSVPETESQTTESVVGAPTPTKQPAVTPDNKDNSPTTSSNLNTPAGSPRASTTPPNLQPVKFSARLAEKAAQRAAAAVPIGTTTQSQDGGSSVASPKTSPEPSPGEMSVVGSTDTKLTIPDKSIPPSSPVPIQKYTTKIMQHVERTFQDFYKDVLEKGRNVGATATDDLTSSTVKKLKVDMDILQWKHQQELAELRHNAELTVAEMRLSLLREKTNALADLKKEFSTEKQAAINETKKKQWCANCGKEAIFFCCWNTSYCDYPCQQTHWPEHMNSCAQSAPGTASQDSTDQSDGVNIDNQVRTAVSIQQSPSDSKKPGDPIPVVVTQPMQVQYVRQPVLQQTTGGQPPPRQVVMQAQVAPPVQSYSTVLAPMNTLTRAPTATIVQPRPIMQQGTYPVLRPQGGMVTQAPQGMRAQIVMPAQVQSVPSGTMQIRNVVSYAQSRPV